MLDKVKQHTDLSFM